MDFLIVIQDKLESLRALIQAEGVERAVQHLRLAYAHFERGRREGPEDLFTDVVYRTNQAFEGILKEAYKILTGQDVGRMRLYDIEQEFERAGTLERRVLEYFTMYRENWRNPSAHDYRLDFKEADAFMALATVAAFCFVALDEMIQRTSAQAGVHGLSSEQIEPAEDEPLGKSILLKVFHVFAHSFPRALRHYVSSGKFPSGLRYDESLLIGIVRGLLEETKKSLGLSIIVETKREFNVAGHSYVPDLMVALGEDCGILELKLFLGDVDSLERSVTNLRTQVLQYVDARSAVAGVGLLLPVPPLISSGWDIKVESERLDGRTLWTLSPCAQSPPGGQ